MTKSGRVVVRTGLALLGLGVLLVLFVAYQLWGTALYTAQAQSHLKTELSHQLHHALPATATDLASAREDGLPTIAKQTAAPLPDPVLNQPVGLLSIPKIGLLDAIVEGVGEAQLEQGPGHYPGTSLPGEPGNVSIAGHRTTYAHPFYNLDALAAGDSIFILTSQGLFHYTVTGNQVVAPTDVTVLDTLPGKNTLTLTTCNPRYSAATRLVVTADFDGRTAPAVVTTTPTTHPKATSLAGDGTTSASLGGGSAPVLPAIAWGLIAIALVVIAVLVWRRVRRQWRFVVVLGAIPLVGIALLVCFEHVSLALPGSF
jgi:sortase A